MAEVPVGRVRFADFSWGRVDEAARALEAWRPTVMPMLFVDCRRCASAFPSGIAPSSEDAGSVLISQVLEECPACGDTRRYDTPDFYFPPRGAESKATESKSGGPLVTPPPHDMGPVVSNQTRPVSIPPESIAEPGHSPP